MSLNPRTDAVVLVAHGTVDELAELPEFLTNIRRGHAPPPELLAEVTRRYEAIGGRSPLNSINRALGERLEERLGVPVRTANRLFRPYPKEVLEPLAQAGARRIFVVPLAQHSASIYGDAVKKAAADAGLSLTIRAAGNWGRMPELTEAFARSIAVTLAEVPAGARAQTTLLLTAHSLPTELRASAADVATRVRELAPGGFADHEVAFQSQGMSTGPGGRPMAWLGPDLRAMLDTLRARGRTDVVIAPIGFLADHVEILYDLDIEAKGWANERGITLRRSASLDAHDRLVDTLAVIVRRLATEEASEGE
jgi:protoporphyrin/coproporphyrin ferrochelatase